VVIVVDVDVVVVDDDDDVVVIVALSCIDSHVQPVNFFVLRLASGQRLLQSCLADDNASTATSNSKNKNNDKNNSVSTEKTSRGDSNSNSHKSTSRNSNSDSKNNNSNTATRHHDTLLGNQETNSAVRENNEESKSSDTNEGDHRFLCSCDCDEPYSFDESDNDSEEWDHGLVCERYVLSRPSAPSQSHQQQSEHTAQRHLQQLLHQSCSLPPLSATQVFTSCDLSVPPSITASVTNQRQPSIPLADEAQTALMAHLRRLQPTILAYLQQQQQQQQQQHQQQQQQQQRQQRQLYDHSPRSTLARPAERPTPATSFAKRRWANMAVQAVADTDTHQSAQPISSETSSKSSTTLSQHVQQRQVALLTQLLLQRIAGNERMSLDERSLTGATMVPDIRHSHTLTHQTIATTDNRGNTSILPPETVQTTKATPSSTPTTTTTITMATTTATTPSPQQDQPSNSNTNK
jgi:hypothetical protein